VRLLEATDRVGGRVRTEQCDGFQIDHGFQVLLTAYPACRQLLDYDALRLRAFEPGALIRLPGRWGRLSDPWRRPRHLWATAVSPVGSLADKARIVRLRRAASRGTLPELFARPQRSTLEHLRAFGFSEGMIDRFFRPFLGGIFLERDLQTSSRMFEFVFRMFSAGAAALPAEGMAAIPRQLAARLPAGTVQLQETVETIDGTHVTTTAGQRYQAGNLVIATEAPAAARLLGAPDLDCRWQATHAFSFAAPVSPSDEPILMLDGTGQGPINHLAVVSRVAPSYAPEGRALISANVVGACEDPQDLLPAVRAQLREWFGVAVDRWDFLQVTSVPFALPEQTVERLEAVGPAGGQAWPAAGHDHLWVCGDHRETSSIQGAMQSGLEVAEALLSAAGSPAGQPPPERRN